MIAGGGEASLRRSRTRSPTAGVGLWMAIGLGCLPAWAASALIAPGRAAPVFRLPDATGVEHELFAAGEVTLIVFAKLIDRDTPSALDALDAALAKNEKLVLGVRRCLVFSRFEADEFASRGNELDRANWKVRLDPEDHAYRAYGIIATPSVVIVGKDGKIAAVHPGYDPGLAEHTRHALAKALGVNLPRSAVSTFPRPDLNIVMGRRLAGRKLWDRALPYYERARQTGKLSDGAILELSEVYIELDRAKDALSALDAISKESKLYGAALALIKRAHQSSSGDRRKPGPRPPVRD